MSWTAFAQTTPPAANDSLWDIVTSGGWPGILILLVLVSLSIAAAYLVIDQVLSLRRDDILPPGLSNEIAGLLRDGKVADADEALRARPSVLAGVVSLALATREFGWAEIEKTVEDTLLERSAAMHRRIDYLSMIANLSPMVGLLGTVTGMIFAFRQVAATSGAAGAGDLAEGIYQALVTTVGGLVVAIPALAAVGVLRNRVDTLMSEVTMHAERSLSPLRRRMIASPTTASPRIGPVAPAQMRGTKVNPPNVETAPPVPADPTVGHPRTPPQPRKKGKS
ncbi:biopolymer transport protein ExbB [Neorhodopirellula lusitana]|uniref:Biopolymer transport protein ExbB n=1 Tax=Neorhodopirellula lusitana TaxID=445327 RepID=A0ABY1Q0M7_9BACT|nr:MotA/TolQ/ExbB proton channel family protein [Neorhodopirellula lusitana]SMP54684.1 biopolymer transport protein ExbB [Neorhodopirellula lusitana]